MYKNFSVILFILATITVIYCTVIGNTEPNWPPYATEWLYYKPNRVFPPIEEWHFYYHLYVPFIIALFLDILSKIYKNKIVKKIILALNILVLISALFWFTIYSMVSSAFAEW